MPAEIKSIFENPQPSAVVSGSAAGSDFLFYTQKQTGWYQVELNNGNIGWIPEYQVTGLKDWNEKTKNNIRNIWCDYYISVAFGRV